jgi:protein-tyrosine-phosphatase
VSSYALTYLFGWRPPSGYQVAGALVILAALSFLILSTVRDARRLGPAVARRVYLFVCGGNTSRSPMAQAICNDEVARIFGVSPIVALSAGLTAEPGRPLTEAAASTLIGLGVKPHDHASRPVTSELVAQAERVFCMTESQRLALVSRFPEAAAKIQRLDPESDLDDPSGQDRAAYTALGERLQWLVRQQLRMLPA